MPPAPPCLHHARRLFSSSAPLLRSRLSASASAASPSSAPARDRRSAARAGPLSVASLQRIVPQRLDVVLAAEGLCLRREARRFCLAHELLAARAAGGAASRVLTGSTKVHAPSLLVDGEALPSPLPGVPLHLALHKPAGYVCSHAEGEGRSVYDLLPGEWQLRSPPLASVGRLDRQATGLLLLTQSGALQARLASPAARLRKEYVVALAAPLSPSLSEATAFASGQLALADGADAAPALLSPHRDPALRHVAKVVLTEGRHHQLRRMFAAVGHAVQAIHRVAIGGLRLPDMGLREGQWRQLTSEELQRLLDASEGGAPKQGRAQGLGAPPVRGRRVRVRGGVGGPGSGQERGEESEGERYYY